MIFVLLTSIAAPTGTPFSLYQSNADPNGNLTPVAGPGALCVRNDAGNVGLHIQTATNVWHRIGGALGPLYPDDVPATFGTTSPAQGTIVYSSANTRFDLTTVDISAVAATQATRPILIETGVRTTTDANAGQVSGALSLLTGGTVQSGAAAGGLSGAWTGGTGTATQSANGVGAGSGAVVLASGVTDSTVAGGTGGPSGAVTVGSGNATSTAGTSGASGVTTLQSGTSEDANTGNVFVQSGNAAAAGGGILSGTVTIRSGTVGGTGTTGTVAISSGAPVGAGISGTVSLTSGNVAGAGTSGNIVLTTGNAAGAGTSGSIRLIVGTTGGGTAGAISLEAATISTTVQATQLQLIDANAAALSIGAAGALNMLVFDTSNAAEELVVNAVNGIRAINDVGHWIGTTASDRFAFRYNSGTNEGELIGTNVTAGGAAAGTRGLNLTTGNRIKNDANAGVPGSGGVKITTGTSDAQLIAGGMTGGPSGTVAIGSGATAASSGVNTAGATGGVQLTTGSSTAAGGGTAGPSGAIQLTTGNTTNAAGGTGGIQLVTGNATAGAGNSGSIVLTTGTSAGGTRGVIDINAPSIDLSTQATDFGMVAANASAVRFVQGGTIFLVFDTTAALQVNATQRLTTTDGVVGGTARVVGGKESASVADSATISQAAAGTWAIFGTNYTLPANTLKSGSSLKITAVVRTTVQADGAATQQMRVRVGGVVFYTSPVSGATPAAGHKCIANVHLTSRGAPGAAVAQAGGGVGAWTDAAPAGAIASPPAAPANVATNGALIIDVQGDWSAAGTNVGRMVLEQLVVEVV